MQVTAAQPLVRTVVTDDHPPMGGSVNVVSDTNEGVVTILVHRPSLLADPEAVMAELGEMLDYAAARFMPRPLHLIPAQRAAS